MIWLFLACTGAPEAPPAPSAPRTVLPAEPQAPAEPVPDTIALRHILISWKNNPDLETQQDALARAESVAQRIAAGEDFRALATEHSDDPGSKARQGWLGAGQRDTWVPAFSEAAFKLQVGQVSEPTLSPFGYHLIRREAMEEIHLHQVLVQHADVPKVWKFDKAESKTQDQALAQAQQALAALEAGQPFDQVAKEYSDGPMALRGGDLGLFLEGELGPAVDDVALALAPGARSEIFETTAGYHILERSP